MDTRRPIVIDNGSGTIKAGFASDKFPKLILPNRVGKPKSGDLKSEVFIGDDHSGTKLTYRYPIENGVVTDWNDMEMIWKYMYGKNQLSILPEEHPVLLSETVLNPRWNKEKALEIFFEKFNVPAFMISLQAVLTLYSTGRTSGIVLDSGDGVSQIVPIYQGFAMPNGIIRNNVAGHDITKYLRLLLKKEGLNFQTTEEFEVLRRIKENLCYIANDPLNEETTCVDKVNFTLPDGKIIQVGPSKFRAPEILFRPDLVGEECSGLHRALYDSIQCSDLDLRMHLYGNVVLSGGSTLFKGFGNRLLREVKKLSPPNIKIKISAPKERLYSVWIGGSILASLEIFKKMSISKKDYDENGKHFIKHFQTYF